MLKNITFLHFITTFHNDVALKIEMGSATPVVKTIFGTRNVKMYVHICMVYTFSKNQERYKVKKNKSKCA